MRYDGLQWLLVGKRAFSLGQADHTSLVLDSDNVPFVAYKDIANSGKATVMYLD